MSLKASLKGRPVIYEIVPPRRDTSRFNTELRGVDEVLHDPRIMAINVPELTNRRSEKEHTHYSPATIPPEEYAMMIKEYKEPIVNIITPWLQKEEFLRRSRMILHEYGEPNLILVGKERREDTKPGPGVTEALGLLRAERRDHVALGGICIFDRKTPPSGEYGGGGSTVQEPRRVWTKAAAGCDFVTSQITFDPGPAIAFLVAYQGLCDRSWKTPLTVFVSLATVPTPSILALVESLDVSIPSKVRRRLTGSMNMGSESLEVAAETFSAITTLAERAGVKVPLGLQIEQLGVHNDHISLRLLDRVYPLLRTC